MLDVDSIREVPFFSCTFTFLWMILFARSILLVLVVALFLPPSKHVEGPTRHQKRKLYVFTAKYVLLCAFSVSSSLTPKSLAEPQPRLPLKIDCPWRPPRCWTFKPPRQFDNLRSRIVHRTNSFLHARPAGGLDFSPKMWPEYRYQSASGWFTQRFERIISLGSVAKLPVAGPRITFPPSAGC